MFTFLYGNAFLLAMAALEYSQAIGDLLAGNYARALIMLCAGTSSIAFIWVLP